MLNSINNKKKYLKNYFLRKAFYIFYRFLHKVHFLPSDILYYEIVKYDGFVYAFSIVRVTPLYRKRVNYPDTMVDRNPKNNELNFARSRP